MARIIVLIGHGAVSGGGVDANDSRSARAWWAGCALGPSATQARTPGSASAIDGKVVLSMRGETEQPLGGEPRHYLFASVRDSPKRCALASAPGSGTSCHFLEDTIQRFGTRIFGSQHGQIGQRYGGLCHHTALLPVA